MKKNLALLAAGALAAISTVSNAAPYIAMHSASSGNNYVAYSEKKTATAAATFCQSKQGHLAVLNNHPETVDVQKYLGLLPVGAYYLGGIQPANASGSPENLITVTGQNFYLDTAYPTSIATSNDSTPDYQAFLINGDPNWDQFWFYDNTSTQSFVCEFEDSAI